MESLILSKENKNTPAIVFEKFKPALERCAEILDSSKDKVAEHGSIQGEHLTDLVTLSIPEVRKGKHAFVAMVDIESSDKKAEFVFRNNLFDAAKYTYNLKERPFIGDITPFQYGIIGNWVVLEKLKGLEGSELVEKIKTDSEFSDKYENKVIDLFDKAARYGVSIDDVGFSKGHNCIANSDSGDIKLIEQVNARPTEAALYEIAFQALNSELKNLAGLKEDNLDYVTRAEFTYSLLHKAHTKFNLRTLHYRARRIKPDHPDYRSTYYIQTWENLSDEVFERIYNDPEKYKENALLLNGIPYSQGFSEELILAIESSNKDKFVQLIRDDKFNFNVKNAADPRYGEIYVEDIKK